MHVTSRLISNPETLQPTVSGSTESVEKFENILKHLNIQKTFKKIKNIPELAQSLEPGRPLRIGYLPLLQVTLKQSVCFSGIYLYHPETTLAFQKWNQIHRQQLFLKLESNQRAAIKHTRVRPAMDQSQSQISCLGHAVSAKTQRMRGWWMGSLTVI